MASKVEIYNTALSHIGINQYVSDPSEQSIEADVCNVHFDQALRHSLEIDNWQFAKKRKVLSLVSGTAPTNWDYQYRYPADALRVIRIVTVGDRNPRKLEPFELHQDSGGELMILTDCADAEIEYITYFDDVASMPQSFIDVLASSLAYRIAMPLTKNPEIRTSSFDLFTFYMDQARVKNKNEQQDEPRYESEFVELRLN